MSWLVVIWKTFKGNRDVQVGTVLVAGLLAFSVWLWLHDRGVRAATKKETKQQSEISKVRADAADEQRKEAINETLDDIRNVSSTDEWFDRMRARQCRETSATKGKADLCK